MSELDNGADIGTGLTISRANQKALMMLPPADRARIIDALLSWSLLGEEGEPIANPFQKVVLDDLKAEHREHVEKHRAFKAKQRENGLRPKTKPRLCHGEATAMPNEATAKPNEATAKPNEATAKPEASQKKPNISISNSISISNRESEYTTRAREDAKEAYPTEEMVLEVARAHTIDENFALRWLRTMQASEWRDTKGKQIPAKGWRAKMAYAWKDEQARRKEGGGRSKGEPSNIHHDSTVDLQGAF